MKKVLFATTAIVMTAGAAAAEVNLKGFAEMGYTGASGGTTGMWQDVEVNFSASGQTDGGISWSAQIDLDETNVAAGDDSGTTVGISGAFGNLTMGDTDGAFDWALQEAAFGPGDLTDASTGFVGFDGNTGLDGRYDGQILRYDNTVGSLSYAVSWSNDDTHNAAGTAQGDDVFGLGLKTAVSGVNVGIGYQGTSTAAGVDTTITGISMDTTFNGMRIGFSTHETSTDNLVDARNVTAGIGYSINGWDLGASYGSTDDAAGVAGDTLDGYAVNAGYSLGGGASFLAAYGTGDTHDASASTTTKSDTWSVGLKFAF
jgi:outer membrane protein OmpU